MKKEGSSDFYIVTNKFDSFGDFQQSSVTKVFPVKNRNEDTKHCPIGYAPDKPSLNPEGQMYLHGLACADLALQENSPPASIAAYQVIIQVMADDIVELRDQLAKRDKTIQTMMDKMAEKTKEIERLAGKLLSGKSVKIEESPAPKHDHEEWHQPNPMPRGMRFP